MKKVLSLVLAFAMILGSFGFVFGTQFSDVTDTEVYSEAVNVLSGLGVIGGYPDGTFKPANVVTRAEMATMIVNCLGIPVSGGSATKFSDVPESHWASGYIAYAASVGFIAGYPDGTFKPEQQVTCNEALTMIIASLGYTLESLNGDYPGAFVNKAMGLGILDTCKKTGTVGAERSDIACYLYDALDAELGVVNKDGEFVSNYVQSGYSKEDNYLVRLGAEPDDTPFIITEDTFDNSTINLVDYLGAYVTVYRNKKDGKIVALKEVKSEYIEDTLANLNKAYKNSVDYTKEVTGYVSFTNGEQDGGQDVEDPTGSIKLAVKLNGKTVEEIYSMQVWDPEKTFQADGVQDEIIDYQSIGGYDLPLDDDDEIDTNAFSIAGRNAITEIEDGDVLTIYTNSNGIVKIEVGTETVYGTVSKITTGDKYTVGDKTFGKHADATDTPDVDDEGTFYLAYNGKWFAFEEADDSTSNYAIVLANGYEQGKYGSESFYLNMFLADGSEKEFAATEDAVKKIVTDPTTAGPVGVMVKYTVNSKDKITGIVKATSVGKDNKFDKNGLCGTIALKDSTAAFEYLGGDVDDAGNYQIIEVSSLYGTTVSGDMYEIDDAGAYKAVLVEGVSGATKSFALFVSKDAKVSDGMLWTALYEGAVKEFTLTDDVSTDPDTVDATSTPAAVYFFTLTFDADGNVTAVKSEAEDDSKDICGVATSVSGNVLTAGEDNFSLSEDIAVYVYDESDEEWAAKDAKALAYRATGYSCITLFKVDGSDVFNMAIVMKP